MIFRDQFPQYLIVSLGSTEMSQVPIVGWIVELIKEPDMNSNFSQLYNSLFIVILHWILMWHNTESICGGEKHP